tara:strand:- start:530 stop:1039 length:510 start_codon:yes stop_codon:yes gene_type:complete
MIGVGEKFPEFELKGINRSNEFVTGKSWNLKDWSVIYFYPKDFTFICPTEIAGMDCCLHETEEVFGISGDNEFCKLAWKQSNELLNDIGHTLLADCGLKLSHELGIVDKVEGVCYRATYIVDPDGIIQHVSVNQLDTGRNADEVYRTLQALKAGGLTGCAWEAGDDFVA